LEQCRSAVAQAVHWSKMDGEEQKFVTGSDKDDITTFSNKKQAPPGCSFAIGGGKAVFRKFEECTGENPCVNGGKFLVVCSEICSTRSEWRLINKKGQTADIPNGCPAGMVAPTAGECDKAVADAVLIGGCGRLGYAKSNSKVQAFDRKKTANPGCSYSFGSKKAKWNGDKRQWKPEQNMLFWNFPPACNAADCINKGDYGVVCKPAPTVVVEG